MQCRNDEFLLRLQGIEQVNCSSRSLDLDINSAGNDVFNRLSRYGHHTRVSGSDDENIRTGVQNIGNIFRLKPVSFFSPPFCIHPVAIDDDIRPVRLPVYYDLSE